jgi:hypothetical protein
MAPIFYLDVTRWINYAVLLVAVVLELFAFVNCLTQRSEAFPVVGRIPKGGWLAITGGSVLVTVLLGGALGILGLVGLTATAIYLLDLRPALRDAVDGHGSW